MEFLKDKMKNWTTTMRIWILRMREVPSSPVFKLILSSRTNVRRPTYFMYLSRTTLNTTWKANQSEIPAPAFWNTAANCLQTGYGSTKVHSVPSDRMGPLSEQPVHPKSRGPEAPVLRWVSVSQKNILICKSESFPDPSYVETNMGLW